MSTRANIKISDDWDSLWFYRHSDGYPSGVRKTLRKFIGWVVEGRIRADAGGEVRIRDNVTEFQSKYFDEAPSPDLIESILDQGGYTKKEIGDMLDVEAIGGL